MLRHGRKFEGMRTDEPGIFIRKIPASRDGTVHLAVEINPVDEKGYPIHKIGVIIRNQEELDAIREILSDEKLDIAMQIIERVDEQGSEMEKH
jgi:hypothetical protein